MSDQRKRFFAFTLCLSLMLACVSVAHAAALAITRQPVSVSAASGKTASTTVTATGDGLKYVWFYAEKGSSTFAKTSVTTPTYSLVMNESRDGRRVFCAVTDKYGNKVVSGSATLSLAKNPAKITRQPASVTVVSGAMAKVSVTATGDGLSYRWYYKDAGMSAYAQTSVTTSSYSLAMNAARNGRRVYCRVMVKYGNVVNSTSAVLSLAMPAKITRQPANATVASGKTATTSVTATGDGLSYRWYYKDTGMSAYAQTSVTTSSYSLVMNAARDGRRVYCRVTDKYGNTVNSTSAVLGLSKPAAITLQPADVIAASGKTATVSVQATGDGLTYRWYYRDAEETSFTASSVTTPAYSLVMNEARDGRQVYCVVTDRYGNKVKSDSAEFQLDKFGDGREVFNGMWQASHYGSLTCSAASVGIQSLMIIEDGEIYIQRKMTDGVISGVFNGTMVDGEMHFSGEGCKGRMYPEVVDGETYMIDLYIEVDGVSHLLLYMSL